MRLWEQLDSPPASDSRCIYFHKDRRFLSALNATFDRVAPKRMVELGVLHGGSTIYWMERYQPDRLAAFDLAPGAPFLEQYLARHELTDRVQTHFGVAQEDAEAVRASVVNDFAGKSVDTVIDDASHQFQQTRATVETLLPFIRPGGAYVIEDWSWGHHKDWSPGLWSLRPLMSPLLSELMLICGTGKGVIDSMEIDPNFAVLWRGSTPLPTDGSFKLVDHYVARDFSIALPPHRTKMWLHSFRQKKWLR